MRRAAALLAGLLALGGAGGAEAREIAFVANAESGTVSVVDAREFSVLREINVLPDGREAQPGADDPTQALAGQKIVEAAGGNNYAQDQDLAPDGRTLYVSRGHRGDVAAFDLASGELRWKVPIPGLRADHMTISADGRRLYVSALTDNHVYVVDTAARAITGSFPTGEWPHDNHLSHDGRLVYNGSIGNIVAPSEARGEYRLTVADAGTLAVQKTFRFDAGIRPYVFDADESHMYAQLSMFHGLVEFDLASGAIARRLELPVDEGVTEDDYDFEAPHHGLAISGDHKVLCAAGRASDYVALVSVAGLRPLAIVDVGDAPGWAATTPDGSHCLVPNTREDTLSVISFSARREVARLKMGDGPKQVETADVPIALACPDCVPALRLSRRCAGNGRLRLRLVGDTDAVRRVSYRFGARRVGASATAPFERVVPRSRLAVTRARRVIASVELQRGRTTLARAMSRCGLG